MISNGSLNCCPPRSTDEPGSSLARPFRVSGIPVYGVNGGWVIAPVDFRAHGKDERIPVQALYDNVVHWELMLRDLAGK